MDTAASPQKVTSPTARTAALSALIRVQQGESLARFFDPLLSSLPDKNKALAHELTYGTLRQWFALERISSRLTRKNQDAPEPEVVAAIHLGLYQLLVLSTAEHAAIFDTVEAMKPLGLSRATGFVNAVLRSAQRKKVALAKKLPMHHSLPNWLAKQLKADWPEQYDALGQALRQPAPVFLRAAPVFALSELDEELAAELTPITEHCFLASSKIRELLAASNQLRVQDRHAQIAAKLFTTGDNLSVLDACAAPGGKSLHLLDCLEPKLLVAVDSEAARMPRLEAALNQHPLAGRTQILCKSALVVHAHTQGAVSDTGEIGFDRILLDAPCTATGVIRRHPDIGLLRQPGDVIATAQLQLRLLKHLWSQLAAGGELLYATCSLLKAENADVIRQFLSDQPDARLASTQAVLDRAGGLVDPKLSAAVDTGFGVQLLPLKPNSGDGFFYALLQKPLS